MTRTMTNLPDEAELRRCLERVIPAESIAAIHVERFALSTSYDAYVVTAQLSNDEQIKLFLKDFGFSVRPKDGAEQRRERELRVYQELLTEPGLGTARHYGSRLDGSGEPRWLLLEFVDGTPVFNCDLGNWTPAAAGIARIHGYFAQHLERLRVRGYLIQHDSAFFWSKIERASTSVAQIAPHLMGQLSEIIEDYSSIVDVMTSQPATLVNGGCRPCNVLIDIASEPARVCVVDWEEAGVGAPLFDLAYLLDGVEAPTLDRLLDSYRQEAATYDLSLPPREDMTYVIDCFRLHMIMNMLSQAVLKGYREKGIAKLLRIGEDLRRTLVG